MEHAGGPAGAAAHIGAPYDIGAGGQDGARPPVPHARGGLCAIGGRLASAFRDRRGGRGGGTPDSAGGRQGRSNWWFLLPIFLHAAGGIMAFFVLRQDDVRKARNCLYLGLSLTALVLVPVLVLAAAAAVAPGAID